MCVYRWRSCFFFFKQKTAYEIGLGIPAEPLFRSVSIWRIISETCCCLERLVFSIIDATRAVDSLDRKSGSAGMPRPISYAVFCLKKKKEDQKDRIAISDEYDVFNRSCNFSQIGTN